MNRHANSPSGRSRRRPRAAGFTLIELIVVMVVVAVTAMAAIPAMTNVGSTRRLAAARQVMRDLSYARERALSTGTRTWVVFAVGANTYTVLQENPASPGRAGAAAMTDPNGSGRTYVQRLNTGEFAGVTLASANFDNGNEVGFDWCAKPLNSTQAPLAAAGVVTLTGGTTVTVQPATGLVTMP
jgi:prepilin-type N-terminal cleavage/methylation domain-containing protein